MPSLRTPHLNPAQAGEAPARPGPNAKTPAQAPAPVADEESDDDQAARAGGFHESSYELQHGLQVSESAWPDDVTVPGGLGER